MKLPKATICLLSLNGEKFIKSCISSVKKQTYENIQFFVIDNGSKDHTVKLVKKSFPDVIVHINARNAGFAEGHNQGIRKAKGEYYIALNQDVILEPDFVKSLVSEMGKNEDIGSASGKLKILTNGQKNDRIDSIGIKILPHLQGAEIGYLEKDTGKYDEKKEIFGPSGAAPIYRMKALEDIKMKIEESEDYEYFDKDFFAYKEDTDLAFRLAIRGWKSIYVPEAIGFHARSIAGLMDKGISITVKQRKYKSKFSKFYSFCNYHFVIIKNLPFKVYLKHSLRIFFYKLVIWSYAIVFEPYLIKAMARTIQLAPKMKRKRNQILSRQKISDEELELKMNLK